MDVIQQSAFYLFLVQPWKNFCCLWKISLASFFIVSLLLPVWAHASDLNAATAHVWQPPQHLLPAPGSAALLHCSVGLGGTTKLYRLYRERLGIYLGWANEEYFTLTVQSCKVTSIERWLFLYSWYTVVTLNWMYIYTYTNRPFSLVILRIGSHGRHLGDVKLHQHFF